MPKMKRIVIVPDGMADEPVDELSGKTPVEAANTPNMDIIAGDGVCGMARTFYEGLPKDSSIANMSIMGYDPRRYFCGRSPLEAINLGIELGEGDMSLRCNLITVEDGRIADFTAGHITDSEARAIMGELEKNMGCRGIEFHPGVSYRNIIVLRSLNKPCADFDAVAPHDMVGEKLDDNWPKPQSEKSGATVKWIKKATMDSWSILESHPVNIKRAGEGKRQANSIWLWGQGTRPAMPSFESMYGLKGSIVSAVDLLNGIGKAIGLDILRVEGITGYIDTNYEGKADAAIKSLKELDFTYIHIESPDECGHEGDIEKKIRAIEDIDKKVVGRILDRVDEPFKVLLMPDHPTPVGVRKHTDSPVPFAIYDNGGHKDGVKFFGESEISKNGSLGLVYATSLMGRLTA